jgi:hypothetical protein
VNTDEEALRMVGPMSREGGQMDRPGSEEFGLATAVEARKELEGTSQYYSKTGFLHSCQRSVVCSPVKLRYFLIKTLSLICRAVCSRRGHQVRTIEQ